MTAGRPFRDPPSVDASGGSRLTITLDAADTRFDVGGRRVFGQSYNGSFVAPTLRVAPSQRVTITLKNHLRVATNLHFHGLHVSPAGTSDDPFVCVPPHHTFVYRLAIPADHPTGTYWYHSHAMGTSCSTSGMPDMFMPGDVENQVFAGLSGALLVGDDRALFPPTLQHVDAHTMVFKDVQLDTSGHILQNTATTTINSNNPTVRLVNGQLRPVLTTRPGATQLWRLVNAGADIFYQLRLDGSRFNVVGEDGRPVARITRPTTLLLPPGKRYDVLVTAPAGAGRSWLRTTAYSNGPQGDAYPDTPLVELHVTGHDRRALPTIPDAIPGAPKDLTDAPIAQRRTVVLSEDSTGTSFAINGRQFAMDTSVFATPARLNTVEEWTVANTTGEDHPFHVHTNAFQVMSINGVAQPYTHQQDTVPVPHAVNADPGRVVIRIPFSDYPGRWMFHCHIAAHEDNAMMSFIDVVP